jgi:hypothetical protein
LRTSNVLRKLQSNDVDFRRPPLPEKRMEHASPLAADTDFARPVDPRRNRRNTRLFWPILVIVAILVAAGVFVWRSMHVATTPAPTPAPPVASTPPATPPSTVAATPKYPIEAAAVQEPEPTPPLPDVANSDAALQDVMASLFNGVALDRIFHMQEIVPRFVATIDNLPRQSVALSKMSVNPVPGNPAIAQSDGKTLLRADNAARYEPYVRVLEQADPQKLVQAYVRYYPLFQKAYQDLGYPRGYFNDRLVEVIDHLLAAPDVPAPVALTQPKVLYEFSDPALESLSAGQKMMIRMGTVNESRVKTKLRAIRRALTGQTLPR